ncbi:TonB-dependent siderophore receptor [Steroidobacter sp.]|uniref:TonB-dependent siderophore receptor n=1 Tax=Steroidobacter sp. TaxID=1978227 RepID=UPI001A43F008|nr:TonB-dependent receptor [Steroidobacter sp.]MBL8268637.1 TonB-dependent siderophore receptor [Steroidobacter sp.]
MKRHAPILGALTASVAFIAAVPVALASDEPAQHYDIEAQSISSALKAFSLQSKIQLIFGERDVVQYQTRGISGTLSPQEALQRLLDGTNLDFEFTANNVVVVRPAGGKRHQSSTEANGSSGERLRLAQAGQSAADHDVTISEVIVTGRLIDNVSMMKRGETLRETPQSVTIMTQQRIDEQRLGSISEVLDQAPGLSVEMDAYNRPSSFYSRGFEVSNMQVDGASVGVNRSYNSSRNLAMYEQVEVLRGADGLFAGSGDPGGTVNLVRKRALDHTQVLINASAGRWDSYQADLDVTGPLAFDGRLRGRVVAQWHDKDFFYNTAASNGRFFYGTVEMDVTDSTLLVLGASQGKSDEVASLGGAPRYTSGQLVPGWTRERAVVADWSSWNEEASEIFTRVEQRLGERWKVTLSAMHEELDLYSNTLYIVAINPLTNLGVVTTRGNVYDPQTNAVDLNVSGKFELFGGTHSVLFGYDSYKTRGDAWGIGSSWDNPIPTLLNPLDFHEDTIPAPSRLTKTWRENPITQQHGIYGRVQMQLAQPFKLIVGGRYSSFESSSDVWWAHNADGSLAATPDSVASYKDDSIFTPYASALYDLNKQWTLYANVTEIFKAQADVYSGPLPGHVMDPIKGRSYELGTKADLRDGRLEVSMALYYIEQTGKGEQDPAYPDTGSNWRCCYLDLGEVISKGIDTGFSGELSPGWSLFGGYTYNENENKREDVPLLTLAPKHMFKLWTSYRLPAFERKWLVGGGVTLQSERFVSGTVATYNPDTGLYNGPRVPFEWGQGGFTVWNAMAQYEISDSWQVSLNANNLFDKTYFAGLSVGSRYAEPRNVILTVRGRF